VLSVAKEFYPTISLILVTDGTVGFSTMPSEKWKLGLTRHKKRRPREVDARGCLSLRLFRS
jgi:hypothetical protein